MNDEWRKWIPILTVADAEKSAKFYCDVLGFEKDFEHRYAEDFPLYVGVSRGPLLLHLSEHGEVEGHRTALYVPVEDVDKAYRDLVERGLAPGDGPRDQPYGVRTFVFQDPDGHDLTLGSPLSDE